MFARRARLFQVGAWLILLLIAPMAHAEHRIALVIGNQKYASLELLKTSAADAASYAALFKDEGFDTVIFKTDLTRIGMDEAISQLIDAIQPGDTAVFVYSGHGWSDGTTNYLVPTDAPKSGSEDLLKRVSVPLENGVNGILDEVQQKGARLKVAIIDACRDNPFTAADGTRSIGMKRGLMMEAPPQGTFIVFSAGAGQTALDRLSDDDPDPNGVFTRIFVPLLKANLTLLDATKAAQEKVFEVAWSVNNHRQQPAFYDETRGNKACLSAACSERTPGEAVDEAAWQRIATSSDPADFEGFMRIFPTSVHVAEAEAKAKYLRQRVIKPIHQALGSVIYVRTIAGQPKQNVQVLVVPGSPCVSKLAVDLKGNRNGISLSVYLHEEKPENLVGQAVVPTSPGELTFDVHRPVDKLLFISRRGTTAASRDHEVNLDSVDIFVAPQEECRSAG